jgi:polar amino acid transport system substrate-binding protein
MDSIFRIVLLFSVLISPLHAVGEPLSVGVQNFNPPYVIRGSAQDVYGFDVDTMNYICQIINRTCQFRMMRFGDLLDSVVTKKIDVAISSITITQARADLVNFSQPYLIGASRFLGNSNTFNQPFSLNALNNQTVGILKGSIALEQLKVMGVTSRTTEYDSFDLMLESLSRKNVDFIFLDSANANFWAANSAGRFAVQGPSYAYGFGYGIAINKSDGALLAQINDALLQYQNSEQFRINYNKYLQFERMS